jgi:uncharacterized membrane protein
MVSNTQNEKLHINNQRISLMLRIMTSASLLLMAAGVVMYMVSGTPQTLELMPVTQLIAHMLTFSPATLVVGGLLIAWIIPVAILAASLAHFIANREKYPVIVCIVVLALLVASSAVLATIH